MKSVARPMLTDRPACEICAVSPYATRAMPAHEQATHAAVGRQLAWLHGVPYLDLPIPPDHANLHNTYFIPSSTLVLEDSPASRAACDQSRFFGGRVPHPFVATKAITHPRVASGALVPTGWSDAFGEQVHAATLPGFSVFCIADARRACRQLLRDGPVRIKPVHATAGRGQSVVTRLDELDAVVADMDQAELALCGLVLETHLENVTTFSVGQVTVCGVTASYVGTQSITPANDGVMVYGGSSLRVVRGDFDALLAEPLTPAWRTAIEQARIYDSAAAACFAGLVASRRNYDMVTGQDAAGRVRSGVLEQSWRIGGASGAELAALVAFRLDPQCRRMQAETVERYGGQHVPPRGADVAYRGEDVSCGPMIKYVTTTAP